MQGKNVIVCLLFAAAAAGCSQSKPEIKRIHFPPGQLVSASECGACHKDIYTAWAGSLHARAAKNPIFRTSYREALGLTNGEAKRLCLGCHAPATLVSSDLELTQKVSQEGVTCDFCHSLRETRLKGSKRFDVQPGSVKFGPVRDAVSTGHDVAYSTAHTSSLHCAGCHEFSNDKGVELLSTYSEWELYKERGGARTCQECHMPLTLANIVDPRVKRVEGALVNLHEMPGGHSLDQLSRSVRLRITEISFGQKGLTVKVTLKNGGAGHFVPTGIPTRKVMMTLDVTAGGRSFHETRLYQRHILNAKGQEIRRDSEMFTQAARIAQDTRLSPGEERTEEFVLPIKPGDDTEVKAALVYSYSPQDQTETETRIEFSKDKRSLPAHWRRD